MHEHHEHEEEPETFAAFLQETDPSLAEWARRVQSSEDVRLAINYGELHALYNLGEIGRRYMEEPPLVDIMAIWAAGYLALIRRRDACRFRRLLERSRAETDERNEGGPS